MLRFVIATLACTAFARAQTDQGQWEAPFSHVIPANWEPTKNGWDGELRSPYAGRTPNRFNAAHLALIPFGPHRGKVLTWNWMHVPNYHGAMGHQHWAIVDFAASPTFLNFDLPMPSMQGDLFCSGHAWTKDGHLFVAGGDRYTGSSLQANRLAYRFDPNAATGNAMWVREPDLALQRWYPGITPLGTDSNGKDLLIVAGGWGSGAGPSINSYEVFDPSAPPGQGTWQINPANVTRLFDGPNVACADQLGIYPRLFLLTSGELFFAGMAQLGYRLDHSAVGGGGQANWAVQAGPSTSYWRDYASAFAVPDVGAPSGTTPDVILRIGGGFSLWTACAADPAAQPTNTTESCVGGLAASDPAWKWNAAPPLQNARYHQNATLLPDGTVVIIGGNLDILREQVCAAPVLQTELFNDVPNAWRSLAPASVRRGYHSASLLLPDGRVLVGGGEQREMDYQIFRPHYLTNGTQRPQILNAPATLALSYGQSYSLEYAAMGANLTVEHAVLLAPGSVTHHSDNQQRYVELEPVPPGPPGTNPTFDFKAPPNSNHAPRGYYLLFLVSNVQPGANRGTPSSATWVYLQ